MAGVEMSEAWLPELSLIGTERKRIKSLVGFRQGHRLPEEKSTYTDAFIGRIAEPELQDDLETRFGVLRSEFQFKRREVTKDGPAAGQGALVTPFFEYVVTIAVDAEDVSQYMFERRVTNVSDLGALADGAFDRVFATLLNTVEIPAVVPIDVEAVIDAIEDADPDDLVLDYNADASECRVQPRDTGTQIVITADGLSVHDVAALPSGLLLTAREFRRRFVDPFADSEDVRRLS